MILVTPVAIRIWNTKLGEGSLIHGIRGRHQSTGRGRGIERETAV